MKFASTLAASGLMLAGLMTGASAFAALPVAGFRPLKLPDYTTHDGALEYTIHLIGGQLTGTVAAADDATFTVTAHDAESDEDLDYTVDTDQAPFMNGAGRKLKREDVKVGDLLVIDGYFAHNSTGMSARRVIDVGPRP